MENQNWPMLDDGPVGLWAKLDQGPMAVAASVGFHVDRAKTLVNKGGRTKEDSMKTCKTKACALAVPVVGLSLTAASFTFDVARAADQWWVDLGGTNQC
jgi:hypothetical protein